MLSRFRGALPASAVLVDQQAVRRKLLTYRQAAEYLAVSERSIFEWVAAGHITPTRLAKRCVRISVDELDRVAREGIPH
ncbi:helix-turn-helix domain-containing protein [Botrimarina sp.]|uniref:helix-turn-helix domain-containing protein n=1 Tax=Botrimarina sp. TaxID=2795802 RepID=UPI0032ED3FAA